MISSTSLSWWHVITFIFIVIFLSYLAERGNSKFMASVVLFILIAVNGLRHGYVDTRAYRNGFISLDVSEVLNLNFIMDAESKDKGFSVISAIIKIFTNNAQTFLFIMAIIIVSCLFWGIINYAPEMTFAVFFFISTGCYLDTMNGMRQALASAIMFAILPRLIADKKISKYIFIVILCATIHASALFFIPIYFIANKEVWSKWTWMIIGFTFLFYILYNSGIANFIFELLEDTTYGEDYGEMLLSGNTSVNILRPAVAIAPIILSYMDRGNDDKNFVNYNICFNISLINFATWIFATKVLYFYRLAMYFQPYMILLLCYELYYMRNINNKKVIRVLAIILYSFWHVYTLYTMGDMFFVGYLKY